MRTSLPVSLTHAPASRSLRGAGEQPQLSPKRGRANPAGLAQPRRPYLPGSSSAQRPARCPAARGVQERATGRMLPGKCGASQVGHFPERDTGCAPPSWRRFREAGRGLQDSRDASCRLTGPPTPAPQRAEGPNPQSSGEAWRLCLGSRLCSEPTGPEGNKEPRPPRPASASPPRAALSPSRRPLCLPAKHRSVVDAHAPTQSPALLTIELGCVFNLPTPCVNDLI